MSKRIFKAMMAVTLTTLLVCMALFIAILFPYFETQLSDELRNELEYLAPNVERDGLGYLERLGEFTRIVRCFLEDRKEERP